MDKKKGSTTSKVSSGTKSKQDHLITVSKTGTKKVISTACLSKSNSTDIVVSNSSQDSFFIQTYVLFWLDTNINVNDPHYHHTIKQLRSIVKNIHVFNDTNECINIVNKTKNEKILMLISGKVSEQILPRIHNLPQLVGVFIFCENKSKYEPLENVWPIIRGIFTDINAVCQSLKDVVNRFDEDSIDISFLTANDISSAKLNELDQSFMYTQLIKEVLIELDYDKEHLHDFLTYCIQRFSSDTDKMKTIQQFQQQYSFNSCIKWYTENSFIYEMLNRALWEQDIDIIIKMGFFIRALHENIKQLQSQQLDRLKDEFTVYRGQGMTQTKFERLKNTIGGLISFNNFLSTSRVESVSLDFANLAMSNPTVVGIHFLIKVNMQVLSTPFADIHELSCFKKEKEILFSMPTVFRIDRIEHSKTHNRLWYVYLSSTSDNDRQLHVLIERMREEIQGPSPMYRLGALMMHFSEFFKAEEVYKTLLSQTFDEIEKGHLYYQLGHVKDNQGNQNEALQFYQKSLEIYLNKLSADHPNIATCYNNIGLVYDNTKDYTRALSFYEKAYEIYKKTLPDDHRNIAACRNSIGLVYNSMGDYETALSFCKQAQVVFEKKLSKIDPLLATSYNNIGLIYGNMKKYPEALAAYKRAVEIGQKALPPNHPNLQVYKKNFETVRKK